MSASENVFVIDGSTTADVGEAAAAWTYDVANDGGVDYNVEVHIRGSHLTDFGEATAFTARQSFFLQAGATRTIEGSADHGLDSNTTLTVCAEVSVTDSVRGL